eukprot:CAMPEP_0175568412 /NCGR_PEP_ID=MMETSP0096-20121207/40956_1 /TAXON_ID=311494 /ORGANISM="Alexandrium monilatum, Strain CCMP3105" /LENGTH=331 /DNA_ID=CAMNT_0016871749 /DNA_START=45 /DNA_END=1040 /DNA_ORIENTATION=+
MSASGDDTARAAGKPRGPPDAKVFCRMRYCALFFVSWLGAALGLRSSDALLLLLEPAGSEPLLQPLWSGMLRRWPWALAHAGFAGSVGIASFLATCIGFTVLDVCRSETKIQKDWFPSTRDLLVAGLPQTAIYLIANALGWIYGYYPIVLPGRAPRLAEFAEQVLVAFVIGDFFIYSEHRIMHAVPFLRQHIHSWHHAYHAPFSWAGGVVHPLEDFVVIICQTTAPILLGHHPLSFWTFVAIWTALLIEEHSGHDVWWAPYNWLPFARCPCGGGAAPHDIHHYKVNKNYGFVLCVWDQLFDTFEPVSNPPVLPQARKETWWEFQAARKKEY